MKPELLERLLCPNCGRSAFTSQPDVLHCENCGTQYPLRNGTPLFSPVPETLVPFDKYERGPDLGTRWRQANWKFLQQAAADLAPDAVILDVGAGRGDFAAIFKDCRYLALDLYPYPEVDLVADLASSVPLKPASLDAVILANVLEHVQSPARLMDTIHGLLRPGGAIIATVPFLLKIHQAPFDFTRFTRYGLEELGQNAGLTLETLEGYYDAAFLLTEARQNAGRFAFKGMPRIQRAAGRAALAGMNILEKILESIIGQGKAAAITAESGPAPVGYHIIYRKPASPVGRAQ